MRRIVVGVIAVVTAGSVFSLAGLGIASAAMAPQTPPGASAAFSTQDQAVAIRTLHDNLESAWKANDAKGMRSASAQLASELATLRSPKAHAAMSADAVNLVQTATDQNNRLSAQLDALHGKSAGDLPVPGLGSLTSLISSLLQTLLSLLTGLLGGLPLPVPPLPVGVPPVGH
jgi:hypothetical protein